MAQGHAHPAITAAVASARRSARISPLRPRTGRRREELAPPLPAAEVAVHTNSGSEATMDAIRIAAR
jgi:glutamate-1-semialdehyde aminotransferase